MEGDFTEMYIDIGGTQRKVYLWVRSLPYLNFYFASGFYHCTFECFAQGSIDAFHEFGRIAKKYRLDAGLRLAWAGVDQFIIVS